MTVQQILNTIAPQFSSISNVNDFIVIAASRTDMNKFAAKYNLAVALRVAHDMTLAGLDGSGTGKAGLINAEREGDLSRNYGSNTGSVTSFSDLMLTGYGQQLYSLIRNNIVDTMVVV